MVKFRLSRTSLPLAFLVSLSLTLFIGRFFHLHHKLLIVIFPVFLIPLSIIFSFFLRPFNRSRRLYFDSEIVEIENFLSIFSSYLRLGFSPELSLIASCKRYNGLLKNLIAQLLDSSIYSGFDARSFLLILARRVKSRESRRILQLFSHAISRDSRIFGKIAFKLLKNLKRNRVLKYQIDLLFTRMKLRVSLISIVFSAVLAMIARLLPIILLFMASFSRGFSTYNIHFDLDETCVFIALGILSFLNTYFVSIIVLHDHPLILSIISFVIYVLAYLFTPSLMRGFK